MIKKIKRSLIFAATFLTTTSAHNQETDIDAFYSKTVLETLLYSSEPLGDEFYTGIHEYRGWLKDNPGAAYSVFAEWAGNGEFDFNVQDINLISGGVTHILVGGTMSESEKNKLLILLKKHTEPKEASWFTDPDAWSNANSEAIKLVNKQLDLKQTQ